MDLCSRIWFQHRFTHQAAPHRSGSGLGPSLGLSRGLGLRLGLSLGQGLGLDLGLTLDLGLGLGLTLDLDLGLSLYLPSPMPPRCLTSMPVLAPCSSANPT